MSPERPATDHLVERFERLVPSWDAPMARVPGHLRWTVTYRDGSAGLLWIGRGGRQFGVHHHAVRETVVVLKGRVELLEPGRRRHAGRLDGLSAPPGAPHALRAVGDEDVVALWCRDATDADDVASYDGDDRRRAPADGVELLRWEDLEPHHDEPGADEGGTMRASWVWLDRERTGPDGRVLGSLRVGCTVVEPGCAIPEHAHPFPERYVVLEGRGAVTGTPDAAALGAWDAVAFPAGVAHGARAIGDAPLRLLWLQGGNAAERGADGAES
jgi:quercetin dioxygenase-like cupin family protein